MMKSAIKNIFAAAVVVFMGAQAAQAQYTIYGAKTGKYDKVVTLDKDSTSYTFVRGKAGTMSHMNRAFSVSVAGAYESKSDFRVSGEVAYLWNKRTETALIGSYGFDSKEAAGTVMQRFYTNPAQSHNWTGFIGVGMQFRDRRFAFSASDEVKAAVEGAAVEAGYKIYDDNNHQIIFSPVVELGAKYRIAKNFSMTVSAYGGYECNKACESFKAYGNHNGEISSFVVPTTANNRGFFGGVKVSIKVSFAKGVKASPVVY